LVKIIEIQHIYDPTADFHRKKGIYWCIYNGTSA